MAKDKFKISFCEATAAAFKSLYADKYENAGDVQIFSSNFIYENLEKPKDPSMGRFALPVFRFGKLLEDKPPSIAAKVAPESNKFLSSSQNGPAIVIIEAAGGFLNARPNAELAASSTIEAVLAAGKDYGNSTVGQQRKILIEYSSPNIAKPFGVGHLRSTMIGNSLRKIFKALDYDTMGINFLGDWGTQFGKMIVAYRKWGSEDTLKNNSAQNLLELYVKFHETAKEDSSLDDDAREAFKKLEQGEKSEVELWEKFKNISRTEFDRIYKMLGVEFDWVTSESFLNDKMAAAIESLEKAGLTSISESALIVDIDDPQLPPVLLRKADGATLYATRDVAGLFYRWQEYKFYQSLYVVGSAQSDYFKQLFKLIELKEKAESLSDNDRMSGKVKHIEFGWVKFGDKAMSTRQGNIVILEDVIDKAAELAKKRIKEKNPKLKTIEETSRIIGTGAVIFSQLSVRRQKDVRFDWDQVLNFEGETGPYLQYTHARLCSLLRNYDGKVTTDIDFALLAGNEESRVIDLLADFPDTVEDAARDYDPFYIAAMLLKLAGAFNRFYQRKNAQGKIDRILSDNKELSAARIALVKSVQLVINKGLYLLGLEAPQEM
ncbi:MAG: arginine--tRNA ligase [candidate division Zixibacteria bacterium]|nr:arginine--tRNA ligase [candidate division Zixibacteria bacterium]